MSETVGYIRCDIRGCQRAAEFKKDKRGKFYIVCPHHGRVVGSTNESQEELQELLDSGQVVATAEELVGVEESEIKPETPERPPEEKPETKTEADEGGRRGGAVVLLVGAIAGAWLWLRARRGQNNPVM